MVQLSSGSVDTVDTHWLLQTQESPETVGGEGCSDEDDGKSRFAGRGWQPLLRFTASL